jgi:hypothetical protein
LAWRELLDPTSSYWLLYSLQLAHRLLIDPRKEQAHLAQRAAARLVSGVVEGKEDLPPAAASPSSSDDVAAASAGGAGVAAGGAAAVTADGSGTALVRVVDEELLAQRQQWQARFLGTGGLQHLYTIVAAVDGPLSALGTPATLHVHHQTASILLTVFHHFFLAVVSASAASLDLSSLRATSGSDPVAAAAATLPPLDYNDLVAIINKQIPPLSPDALLSSVDSALLSRQLVTVANALTVPAQSVDLASGPSSASSVL